MKIASPEDFAAGKAAIHEKDYEKALVLFTRCLPKEFQTVKITNAAFKQYRRSFLRARFSGEELTSGDVDMPAEISILTPYPPEEGFPLLSERNTKEDVLKKSARLLKENVVNSFSSLRDFANFKVLDPEIPEILQNRETSVQSPVTIAHIFLARGRTWHLLGKHSKAVEDYSFALRSSLDEQEFAQSSDREQEEGFAKFRSSLFILRAHCYSTLQRYDLALLDFEMAKTCDPKNASINIGKAQLYMKCAQYEAAFRECKVCLELDAHKALAYLNLGIIYAQMNTVMHAIQGFSQSLAYEPQYETYILRGKAWFAKGENPFALKDFSSAISLNPELPLGYGNRAALHAEMGNFEEAVRDVSLWIKYAENGESDSTAAYQARGVWLAKLGRLEEAIADFKAVIEKDARHILAYSSLATAYSHLQRHEESVQCWLRAIKLYPQWPKPYGCAAREYLLQKDYRRAIVLLTYAVHLDPKNADTFRERSRAYSKLGYHDRAVLDLNVALQLDEKNAPEILKERAYEKFLRKDCIAAITDLSDALKLQPYDASLYEQRAAVFYAMGRKKFGLTDLICAHKVKKNLEIARRKAEDEKRQKEALEEAQKQEEERIRLEQVALAANEEDEMEDVDMDGSDDEAEDEDDPNDEYAP